MSHKNSRTVRSEGHKKTFLVIQNELSVHDLAGGAGHPHPKKSSKIDFIQKLPDFTPNIRGGKEPEFKSFPALKRVLTLSDGKNSKIDFWVFFFLAFWGAPATPDLNNMVRGEINRQK